MIRYVLAALLVVVLLGMGFMALDEAGTDTSEQELQSAITAIEEDAIDLAESEELSPAAHPNPQRVVEITIPPRGFITEGVSNFEIEPVDENASIARYRLDDGTKNEVVINERIVYYEPTENRTYEIGGRGTQHVTLTLLPDENNNPVVVAEANKTATGA